MQLLLWIRSKKRGKKEHQVSTNSIIITNQTCSSPITLPAMSWWLHLVSCNDPWYIPAGIPFCLTMAGQWRWWHWACWQQGCLPRSMRNRGFRVQVIQYLRPVNHYKSFSLTIWCKTVLPLFIHSEATGLCQQLTCAISITCVAVKVLYVTHTHTQSLTQSRAHTNTCTCCIEKLTVKNLKNPFSIHKYAAQHVLFYGRNTFKCQKKPLRKKSSCGQTRGPLSCRAGLSERSL